MLSEKMWNLYWTVRNRLEMQEEGQGLAEYALLLGLIAVVVIAAVTLLGTQINTVLGRITTALSPVAA